ncbi:MAG TPA: aminoacyl-tRNA hydrolase [Candidatus Limnocylindria bacterium]|jgi:PTH1 family peptidyl-tRNA hydrolase|nr:aminoacyl-tRNA hydrolase [Candidatus Limnocylindria bacterium]
MDELSMVVGLGNPGPKYADTRHNAGFIVVDALAKRWGLDTWQKKGEARFALDRGRGVLLVEPQSYMNLSGPPTLGLATFYKIPPQRILVVVDELDLPFGTLRMRAQGSSGGHNGLKSLIGCFGQEFPRLRVGIGRGADPDAIDRVLGVFSPQERTELPAIVERAVDGVEVWLDDGVAAAMNRVNMKV